MPILYAETDDKYDCFGILHDPGSGDCQNCAVYTLCGKVFQGLVARKRFTRIHQKRLLKAARNPQYGDLAGVPAAHIQRLVKLRNLKLIWGKWSTFYYKDIAIISTDGRYWYSAFPDIKLYRKLRISDIKELDEYAVYYIKQVQKNAGTMQENSYGAGRKRLRSRRKKPQSSVGGSV